MIILLGLLIYIYNIYLCSKQIRKIQSKKDKIEIIIWIFVITVFFAFWIGYFSKDFIFLHDDIACEGARILAGRYSMETTQFEKLINMGFVPKRSWLEIIFNLIPILAVQVTLFVFAIKKKY